MAILDKENLQKIHLTEKKKSADSSSTQYIILSL